MSRILSIVAASLFLATPVFAKLVWPTESTAFASGAPDAEILQTTAGGKLNSGNFGDVRNGGYKFHEGIDIKPIRRDRKGEPLDDIFAVMDGKIRYINRIGGNSGYGRYIAITHPQLDVEVYTLYAHLSEIDSSISVGSDVKAGQRIGKMGRSASYGIAKPQAHLHFEIGLRSSDSFDLWYKSKNYKERNYAGNYNGMNLVGFDPLDFFKCARGGKLSKGIASYISSIPAAFVVRVHTKKVPDFVKLYPALSSTSNSSSAWDIHFTWFGFVKKFERARNPDPSAKEGDIEIIKVAPSQLNHKCRRMIVPYRNSYRPNDTLKEYLRCIFI